MRLLVNGTEHDLDVAPDMPLLWALRDSVGLTGTKFGCGIGLSIDVHGAGAAQPSAATELGSGQADRKSSLGRFDTCF